MQEKTKQEIYKFCDDNKIHLVVKLDGGLGDIIIALNYLQQLCLKMEFILSIIVPDTYKKSVICFLSLNIM